jgi:aminoglycoside phosphotransferase (APT) family kinase protein
MTDQIPSEEVVKLIISDITNSPLLLIERFITGKDNYVFDVKTKDKEYVVRLNTPERAQLFRGAVNWYNLLKPKGIPFPTILYQDLEEKKYGFPVIVMERLPGKDLAHVYNELTNKQKEDLATDLVTIQKAVSTLPQAHGFGYATSLEDKTLHSSWRGVMDTYKKRIVTRNEKTRLIDDKYIQKLKELYKQFSEYFSKVQAVPFLDDTTTKNVIINNGKLSGIVDVDYVCFGDPLLVVALTQASLLDMKADTHYTDYWVQLLKLSGEQKKIVNMYSAMFVLEFASVMGHTFNQKEAEKIDYEALHYSKSLFDTLFDKIQTV